VTAGNAAAWIDAGVFAVGFVASLFDPGDLREERFDAIEQRARQCVQAAHSAPRPGEQ